MIGHRLFNGCALHFPVMHPDSGGGLCRPGVLGSSSCRNCGNPLAMLKRAFPRHTASNGLLKRHISTLSPIFHAASSIYPPTPSPASLLFFFPPVWPPFFPISLHFLHFFCSQNPSPSLVLPFCLCPPPSSRQARMWTTLWVDVFPSLSDINNLSWPHPDPPRYTVALGRDKV